MSTGPRVLLSDVTSDKETDCRNLLRNRTKSHIKGEVCEECRSRMYMNIQWRTRNACSSAAVPGIASRNN